MMTQRVLILTHSTVDPLARSIVEDVTVGLKGENLGRSKSINLSVTALD